MSKDRKPSLLDRLIRKAPAAVIVQDTGAAEPAAEAPSKSHPKKDGGGRFSSIFGSKSKSKVKKPAAGAPTDPAGEGSTDQAAGTATPAEGLDPWSRAYAELKKQDSTKFLVETCEKILTYRANEEDGNVTGDILPNAPNQFSTLSEPESVDKLSVILQPVLNSYQKETWWGTALEGADTVISKIGKGVGDALQACQPAAFAWSAICLTVPILVQPLKEQKKVATGLEYVIERMDWFISLSKVVMKMDWPDDEPFRDHRASTENEVVKLFKTMLRFEMECACRAFETHTIVRLAGDVLQLGDWDTKLENIKTLDSRISKDIQGYQLSQLTLHSSQIAENTEDLLFEVRQIKLIYAGGVKFTANKELNKLIRRFGTTTYLYQMRLNPERHRGTCKWFRAHPKYRAWLKSPERNVLHVTAEPGCGKSVLARCLVEEDLPARRSPEGAQSNLDPVVCYFFFKDNDTQRHLVNALGDILYQLFSEHKEVAKDFADEIDALSDELLKETPRLWDIFVRASEHDFFENSTIYCVFDALDECSASGREELIKLLHGCVTKKKRIRFLVTSRPNQDIIVEFRQGSQEPVKLEGGGDSEKKELQKEIDIVFRFKVDELVRTKDLSPAVAELLETKLVPRGKGQRTYLWASLVFKLIAKETPRDLLKWAELLDTLPHDVAGAYDRLLSNVNKDSRGSVLTLLHIVYIAARPLTLSEANVAVHIRGKYDAQSIESLGIDDNSFKKWLERECGFFIALYEARLFFIYQTAREFLSGSKRTKPEDATVKRADSGDDGTVASEKPSDAVSWENSIKSDQEAHRVMLECCFASMLVTFKYMDVQRSAAAVEPEFHKLWILVDDILKDESTLDDEDDRLVAQDQMVSRLVREHKRVTQDRNVFFGYSADFWIARHFNAAGPFWADDRNLPGGFAPPKRRGTWSSLGGELLSDDDNDDGTDKSNDKSVARAIGASSSAADDAALFAAYRLFMSYPTRSVFSAMSTIRVLVDIMKGVGSCRRYQGPQRAPSGPKHSRIPHLLSEVGKGFIFNCSALPWACLYGHDDLVRVLLGENPDGSFSGLQMPHASIGCKHSEELEVLLCFVSLFGYEMRDDHIIQVLLRYEWQKQLAHPERKEYFIDILQLSERMTRLPTKFADMLREAEYVG